MTNQILNRSFGLAWHFTVGEKSKINDWIKSLHIMQWKLPFTHSIIIYS